MAKATARHTYEHTRNFLTFVNTTAIAYGQKIARSLKNSVLCNSSRVYKRQKITSTSKISQPWDHISPYRTSLSPAHPTCGDISPMMHWPGLLSFQILIHIAFAALDRLNFCSFSWIPFDNFGRLGFSGMIQVPGISESLARVVLSTVQYSQALQRVF